jgi:heat shock protein HslJ
MRALVLALLLLACAPPAPPPTPEDSEPAELSLAGSQWVMMIEHTADGAPTLDFGAGNRANGFTGCNAWFAQVVRSDGGLRFQAIGMTRRACDEPAMALERDFADMLARTHGVVVEDGVLTLTDENGAALVQFARVS